MLPRKPLYQHCCLKQTTEGHVCHAGAGLQKFTLVLDPCTVPAALKSVIVHFILVACSFLDDAQVKQLHQTHTGQPAGLCSSMLGRGEQQTAESQPAGPQQESRPVRSSPERRSSAKQPRSGDQKGSQSSMHDHSDLRIGRRSARKDDRAVPKMLRREFQNADAQATGLPLTGAEPVPLATHAFRLLMSDLFGCMHVYCGWGVVMQIYLNGSFRPHASISLSTSMHTEHWHGKSSAGIIGLHEGQLALHVCLTWLCVHLHLTPITLYVLPTSSVR